MGVENNQHLISANPSISNADSLSPSQIHSLLAKTEEEENDGEWKFPASSSIE